MVNVYTHGVQARKIAGLVLANNSKMTKPKTKREPCAITARQALSPALDCTNKLTTITATKASNNGASRREKIRPIKRLLRIIAVPIMANPSVLAWVFLTNTHPTFSVQWGRPNSHHSRHAQPPPPPQSLAHRQAHSQ